MRRNVPFAASVLILFCLLSGCASNPLVDDAVPAVIISRADDMKGVIDVYVDGRKMARLPPGGKWGKELSNGRHTISITYNKKRSRVQDFRISYNRQHFQAMAFVNDRPGLMPF